MLSRGHREFREEEVGRFLSIDRAVSGIEGEGENCKWCRRKGLRGIAECRYGEMEIRS